MPRSLSVLAIPTRLFEAGENLEDFVNGALKAQNIGATQLDGAILAVTSKIVSLAESRLAPADIAKETLIRSEADLFLGALSYGSFLTIKHGILMASAGIDESNSPGGSRILLPLHPYRSARRLRDNIARQWGLRKFGILLSDSQTRPLRAGVSGIALAHSGFRAIEDKVGHTDLFGRPLKMTRVNVVDALAAAAVYCMGECDESAPLALLRAPLEFHDPDNENPDEAKIPLDEDLYASLFESRRPS